MSGAVRNADRKKYAEIPKQYAEIRRNTLSIRRNTQAKTPLSKTPPAKTPLYPPLSQGQVSTLQNRTYQVWMDFNNFKLQNGICQEILPLRFRFLLKKIRF